MAKSRVTKKTVTGVTIEQANEAAELFAQKYTSLKKVEAEMNEKINAIRSEYKDRIGELQEALKDPHEALEVFAKEQKANWGKKKSMELVHCVVGFRTGNPTVTKAKKFTWDAVLELVKKKPTLAKLFIRTKEELDKEAILAEKNPAVLGKLAEDCFITVEQEEKFYVEPKTEEVTA